MLLCNGSLYRDKSDIICNIIYIIISDNYNNNIYLYIYITKKFLPYRTIYYVILNTLWVLISFKTRQHNIIPIL